TAEAVLAGLSLALAFGTKAYAPLALPVLVLVVAVGTTKSRAIKLAAIGVVAFVVGSTWNFLNLVKTGSYEGHVSNENADYSLPGFLVLVAMPARSLLAFSEVPGARGWWVAAYVVSGAFVVAWLVFRPPGRSESS